jgi:hypothetical protein
VSPLRSARPLLCLAALLSHTADLAAEEGAPFRIRNLNPLVAIFGLPAWDTVVPGTRAGATMEVANHYRLSARSGDRLILDGETLRTTFSLAHAFGEAWAFGLELPHYRVSGGQLDDLIDGWHSAFGMPDGGRNNRPEDALLFQLSNRGGPFFRLDRPQSGIGDLQLKLARSFGAERQLVVQGTVKVPTGAEDILAGSGSTDVGLTVLRLRPLTLRSRSASFYWGAGILHAGDAERIEFANETLIYTGILGGSWQIGPRLGVKGQLDFHGPFFDSPLEEIGERAIQATVGAWFRPSRRALLEFAVVEDLEVSTAPDIVLHVAAHWSW